MKINIRMVVAIVGLAAIASHSVAAVRGPLQASRSAWEGVYTEEQAKRGQEVYSAECSKCHAADLSGVDEAPALAGGAFLSNWDGLTVGDLSERIRISMPPNKQGKLTRQQIVDVIGYVLSANSFPAGKTEMDQRTEVLKQIKIEQTKPKAGSGS
jgi:mono/diheme cytochrome c family protein